MNLINFINDFPDEKSCILHFKEVREKQGIVCKKCGGTKHYWLKAKNQWQCAECEFRTGIKSGTMMQYAKLPLRTWYLAMAFMTFSKKGISARELQRQLDHKRYEPIWSMMHKIRYAMGQRDDLYELAGMLEFDEGYFETETSAETRNNLKRGKGSQRQVNVAVMAESIPLEDIETGKASRQCRYFKMKVLDSYDSEEINNIVQNNINPKSIVFSDKSTSYVDITNFVDIHIMEKSTKDTTKKTLPWVHIAISNAKRNFLGIYHKINSKYLQLYLDEFCYKLNRRYFKDKLFDRLTIAVAGPHW